MKPFPNHHSKNPATVLLAIAALWLLPSCAGGLGGIGAAFSDSMEPLLAQQLAASVVAQMPMEEDPAANASVILNDRLRPSALR